MRGKAFLTVAGLILAAAGIAFFNFGQTPSKIDAQATGNYTTNWVASEVYQLISVAGGPQGTDFTAAIGVSKWIVTGTIGSTSFSETWAGPDAGTARIGPDGGGPVSECNTNNYDRTVWLIGCAGVGSGQQGNEIRLRSVVPTTVFTEGSGDRARWSGGAADCDTNVPGCWVTTGSYGFQNIRGTGGDQAAEIYGSFMMMPLKWTVTGTIN